MTTPPPAANSWTETSIAGHSCDLYEPPRRNLHGFVVLYLHGVHLGKLHDQSGFMESLARHGLPVVAPVSQRSWWTDRICEEFDAQRSAERHVVECVVPWIEEHYQASTPKIALLGTSMGGQGALRLAYKHPNLFPIAAAISPAVDYHKRIRDDDPTFETLSQMYRNAEDARQDTCILYIHPLNWPRHQFFCCDPADPVWFDGADRLRMKLWSLGVPHECDLETTGGGHSFAYYNRMAPKAIDFIAERLERERLRVV